MTYLLIDVPIKITNKAEPNTLCLAQTESPQYYVASSRFLLVVSVVKDAPWPPRTGEVWEVSDGWFYKAGEEWDSSGDSLVLPENVGKAHTKIVFKRVIPTGYMPVASLKLSDLMKSAPRFDHSGGFRGAEGSIKALQYERGVKRGSLWLTEEAAQKLDQVVGNPARKGEKMAYLSRLIMEDE